MREWSSLTDAFLDYCDADYDFSNEQRIWHRMVRRNYYAIDRGIPSIFD